MRMKQMIFFFVFRDTKTNYFTPHTVCDDTSNNNEIWSAKVYETHLGVYNFESHPENHFMSK